MIKRRYTDEFKLSVVKDYYDGSLGIRAIASKYNFPSKNYINQRKTRLKKRGLLPPDATKPKKTTGRTKNTTLYKDEKTPREKQYEKEIQILKAKVAYCEELEHLQPFVKKIKIREMKYKAILALELQYPVWLLCEIAGVNRSTYYKYKKKPLRRSTPIGKLIIDIYNKTHGRAGYRTIKYILKNEYNLIVNHKKVLRIMQKNGIQSIIRRKPKTPTMPKEQAVVKKIY